MNNRLNIEDLTVIDYKVDKYHIYHVYFLDDEDTRQRYFLSGGEFEKWCFTHLQKMVIDLDKETVLKILEDYKRNFHFTLQIEMLYPR